MRIFEHPNMNGFTCPICGKSDDKPVTLVGIAGTEDDGNMKARQVHVDCFDLISYKMADDSTTIISPADDSTLFIDIVLDEVYE